MCVNLTVATFTERNELWDMSRREILTINQIVSFKFWNHAGYNNYSKTRVNFYFFIKRLNKWQNSLSSKLAKIVLSRLGTTQTCCWKCLSYLLPPGFNLVQGRKATGARNTTQSCRPCYCCRFSSRHALEGLPLRIICFSRFRRGMLAPGPFISGFHLLNKFWEDKSRRWATSVIMKIHSPWQEAKQVQRAWILRPVQKRFER